MNKTIKKINIGVIGVGHLGEHHVKHLKSIDSFKLIGIHDINEKRAKSIGTKYGIPLYNNINELIDIFFRAHAYLFNFIITQCAMSVPAVFHYLTPTPRIIPSR